MLRTKIEIRKRKAHRSAVGFSLQIMLKHCYDQLVMSNTIEFKSRVGADGVLDIHVPLGEANAGTDVVISIRQMPAENSHVAMSEEEWRAALKKAYGSAAGLGLERHPQGEYEIRETIE